MRIAVMTFRLRAPLVHSLKEKRMIIKSLMAKLEWKQLLIESRMIRLERGPDSNREGKI